MMLFDQIRRNKQKTIMFMMCFLIFIQIFGAILGELFFGSWNLGLSIVSVVAIGYMGIVVSESEDIIMRMNNAIKVDRENNLKLYNIVEEVSLAAGLKEVPNIYIVDDNSLNAFATGLSPNKSAIAVTAGLLEKLNREELVAVISHEMAHICGYDCRISTVTIALMSAVVCVIDNIWFLNLDDDVPAPLAIVGVIFIILSPVIASVIHYTISRNREYCADAMSINYTRNPDALKKALQKISGCDVLEKVPSGCAAMYISNPCKKDKRKAKKVSFFSTHPSIESRIERLEKM